jgi:hypothetical protein
MSGSFLAYLLHIDTSLRIGGAPVMTDQPETTPCLEEGLRQCRSSGSRVREEPPSVSAAPRDTARMVRLGL